MTQQEGTQVPLWWLEQFPSQMVGEKGKVESIKLHLLNRGTLSHLYVKPVAFLSLRRPRTWVDSAVANIRNFATSIS